MNGTKKNGGSDHESSQKTPRVFTMLENNPEVMTDLAHRLGASSRLRFYDVWSLSEPELLSMIPRPVYGLLATIPMTEAWKRDRDNEDSQTEWYTGAGSDEPVIWFQQTVIDGCGLIGLIHCLCNGVPSQMIASGSELAKFIDKATPLHMNDRALLLDETESLYEMSEASAIKGDTFVVDRDAVDKPKNHFLALVQGKNDVLWELEGSRKGPLNRGTLIGANDALSDQALDMGIRRLVKIQQGVGESTRFSCIALALDPDE